MQYKFPMDRNFRQRLVKPDTWWIHGVLKSSYTYLLIGEERALVLDSGLNRNSIRDYIETITELPLSVCNTCGKWESSGSNGQFRDCRIYMSAFAATQCRQLKSTVNPIEYCIDYESVIISEGDRIELGKRDIEAVEIGCHNPGSLGFIDHTHKILFSGYEVKCGAVLIGSSKNPRYGSVERYQNILMKLKNRSHEFDTICPAQSGSPMDASILDAFIENCQRILCGIEGCSEPGRAVEKTLLHSDWKGTSIVYDRKLKYLADETL